LESYPNPFNSTTLLSYSNLEGGDIEIYDITGRLVRILHSGGIKEGSITWDATDNSGKDISSGVYFAKTMTPQGLRTLKIVYLK